MSDDFEELRNARKRWLSWLDGDEVHSINSQLSTLLWQDTVFRVFNEGRKYAHERKTENSAVSPILAEFLDRGYVGAIVLGITKLVEWSDPKQPAKGVVSLRRLVDDISANKHLLTRKAYLGIDGFPYDFEKERREQLRPLLAAENQEGIFVRGATEPEKNLRMAELAHGQFDSISDSNPENRTPEDRISDRLLSRLNEALKDKAFEDIRTVRHKAVAHAADELSRQERAEKKGLSFNEIDQALKILLSVRQVVQATILNDSWRAGAVPVPQYDQFQYLDKPFIDKADIERLHNFWHDHSEARDKWLHEGHSELLGR